MAGVDLAAVACRIASKGILAADESTGTIGKRLEKHGLENNEGVRRAYRELYMTCPGLGQYLSGAILFKETLMQSSSRGTRFVDCLKAEGIAPGIKLDEGLEPLPGGLPGETHTLGLAALAASAARYAAAGAEFAKWRATLRIQAGGPSEAAVARNADELAEYAAVTQAAGLVPVVEPEILIEGNHDIGRAGEVCQQVLSATVAAMWRKGVLLDGALLKPQMVLQGTEWSGPRPTPQEVAHHTVTSLRRVVPPAIPGILFLSGGQTEEEATLNLQAINEEAQRLGRAPWALTFSFGRALQHSVLTTWAADQSQVGAAQAMALALAEANFRASRGQYSGPHPSTASAQSLQESFRGWRGAEGP
ncbi:fructose-bisphosphate aldolase [Haematococcus lacustris]